MTDEILTLAQTVGSVPEEDGGVLRSLCELAVQELTRRLKTGVTVEDCAPAFRMAGAWLALAGYLAGNGGGVLKAGDLTIEEDMNAANQASMLRQQAERVMAPYLLDEGFSFRGVRG